MVVRQGLSPMVKPDSGDCIKYQSTYLHLSKLLLLPQFLVSRTSRFFSILFSLRTETA